MDRSSRRGPPKDDDATQSGRKMTAAVGTAAPADHRSANHPSAGHPADASASAPSSASLSAKISPKARRLASEQGVNLAVFALRSRRRNSGVRCSRSRGNKNFGGRGGWHTSRRESRRVDSRRRQRYGSSDGRTHNTKLDDRSSFLRRARSGCECLLEARQQLASEIEKSDAVKLTHSDLLVR